MLTGRSSRRSTLVRSVPFTVTRSPLTDGKFSTDARARYRPGNRPSTRYRPSFPDRILIDQAASRTRPRQRDQSVLDRTLLFIEDTPLDRHAASTSTSSSRESVAFRAKAPPTPTRTPDERRWCRRQVRRSRAKRPSESVRTTSSWRSPRRCSGNSTTSASATGRPGSRSMTRRVTRAAGAAWKNRVRLLCMPIGLSAGA